MKQDQRRFLNTKGRKIVLDGKDVRLRGVNVGGWLMMEGYIMQARNLAVQIFKKDFSRTRGEKRFLNSKRNLTTHLFRKKISTISPVWDSILSGSRFTMD